MHIKRYNDIMCYNMLLLGFLSTFSIMKVFGFPIVVTAIIIITFLCSISAKGKFKISKLHIVYIGILIIGYLSATINYMKYSHVTFISVIIVAVTIILTSFTKDFNSDRVLAFIKGLKYSCIFQIIWSLLQYIFFNLFKIDINEFFFVDVLHSVSEGQASRYRNGILTISGLSQHPANLIPILIIAYFLIDKWYVKIICLFIAFSTQNSTAVLALLLCLAITFTKILHQKITKRQFMIGFAVLLVVIIVLLRTDIWNNLISNVQLLYNRIFVASDKYTDSSTYVHKRYYTSLFTIWSVADPLQILFGYGKSSSGYPFTLIYHQYENLLSWNVESNLMDSIYGTGILGTAIYYYWFFQTAIKGYRVDQRYTYIFGVLFICGIFYDNQFTWVFLSELFIGICIDRKINIFHELKILSNKK